jgi:Fe2+ transport system protein FeoA
MSDITLSQPLDAVPRKDALKSSVSNISSTLLPLTQVPLGASACIISQDLPGALGQRLVDLGFTPGAKLTPLRWGPQRNLLAVLIRSTVIALRSYEASAIAVIKV